MTKAIALQTHYNLKNHCGSLTQKIHYNVKHVHNMLQL